MNASNRVERGVALDTMDRFAFHFSSAVSGSEIFAIRTRSPDVIQVYRSPLSVAAETL